MPPGGLSGPASPFHSYVSNLLLSKPCLRFVFFVERWLLSALFIFLGYEYLDTLRLMHLFATSGAVLPASMIARDGGFLDGIHFEDFARYTLLAVSNLTCGVLLLIARQPTRYPTRPSEITVPLAATFFYAIFNQHVSLPLWLTTPFTPVFWSTGLAAVGVVLSVVGVTGSLFCVLVLGRSLGIVVSVREIVLHGPYRYVRHPIYLGYFFVFVGLFLTACTVRMGVLTVGAAGMLCWRARLEEAILSAHSPAYRGWMARTGFLWPRSPIPKRRQVPVRSVFTADTLHSAQQLASVAR